MNRGWGYERPSIYAIANLFSCYSNAPIKVKPQGGGYPQEFDIVGLYLGQDFDNFFVPRGGIFMHEQ